MEKLEFKGTEEEVFARGESVEVYCPEAECNLSIAKFFEVTDEKSQANAKLFAASKDLLEALQEFERLKDIWLPNICKAEHIDEVKALNNARNQAIKAIKKALK